MCATRCVVVLISDVCVESQLVAARTYKLKDLACPYILLLDNIEGPWPVSLPASHSAPPPPGAARAHGGAYRLRRRGLGGGATLTCAVASSSCEAPACCSSCPRASTKNITSRSCSFSSVTCGENGDYHLLFVFG